LTLRALAAVLHAQGGEGDPAGHDLVMPTIDEMMM
jgi:hypothetical protein